MKSRRHPKSLAAFVLCFGSAALTSLHAQGTFRNLDFEASTVSQTQPAGLVDANQAFPFWTAYGTFANYQVLWEDVGLGSTLVCLFGTNGSWGRSIEGGYSAYLQGGVTAPAAAIEQTGLVPVTAQSILFKAQAGSGSLLVSLGGQNIPVFALSTGGNYVQYGADVSSFAGLIEPLRFSALRDSTGPNNWNIDDIVFSTNPIPEPGIITLLTFGAALFGLTAWRRKA